MKQFRQHTVLSFSQNMLSPAHYRDGIDNAKKQGNTVNKSEGNDSAQKNIREKKKETTETHQKEAGMSQSNRAHADKANFLFR